MAKHQRECLLVLTPRSRKKIRCGCSTVDKWKTIETFVLQTPTDWR